MELVDERILKSATPPSASCCSSLVSDPSNMQEDQDEDSVSETSASSSCSFSASARRRRWVILREEVQLLLLFLLFLFLLLIILIITISRSSCRRRLAEADMESLSEVSTRGGLWRSRFRHHHRKLLSCCQDGDLILLLLTIITILIKSHHHLEGIEPTAQQIRLRNGTRRNCQGGRNLLSVQTPESCQVPALSHIYKVTFCINTCTCICSCTWCKHPSLVRYLRFLVPFLSGYFLYQYLYLYLFLYLVKTPESCHLPSLPLPEVTFPPLRYYGVVT